MPWSVNVPAKRRYGRNSNKKNSKRRNEARRAVVRKPNAIRRYAPYDHQILPAEAV